MGALITINNMVARSHEYMSLPAKHRQRIQKWAATLENIECKRQQGRKLTGPSGIYAEEALALGLKSITGMIRTIKEWERTQDWRVFLDARVRNGLAETNDGATSARFKAFWLHLCEKECRSSKSAYEKLLLFFQFGGCVIPGFEKHTPAPGAIPAGCSFRNLLRVVKEHKKELEAARRGINTVSAIPVLSTRRGLRPGQFYNFDDMVHDNYVMWKKDPVRVTELGVVDVASACRIYWGNVPNFERAKHEMSRPESLDQKKSKKGKRQGIERKMSLMIIAYVLRYIGLHPDGCVIMMEHGSATLPKHKIDLLENCMGGIIEIRKGGIKGANQKLFGGYAARGKGNPQAKSLIEGRGNIIHNRAGHLPAQTGWTGRNEPAITWKVKSDAVQVEYWKEQLIEKGRHDLAALLDSPMMSFDNFIEYLNVKYAMINGGTDHSLEGWDDNTVMEYDIGGVLISAQELEARQTPEQKQMFRLMVQSNPQLCSQRLMSPLEVWDSGKSDLIKIPFGTYVELIGDNQDFGKTVKVNNGLIRLKDEYVNDGKEMVYYAQVRMENRSKMYLDEGKTYRAVINPFAAHELVVMEENGVILGMAEEYTRIRANQPEYYKLIGQVESMKVAAQAKQRARFESDNLAVASRRERNRTIAEQGGVAAARKGFAKAGKRGGKVSSDLPDTTWLASENQEEEQSPSSFDLGLDDATEIDFLGF